MNCPNCSAETRPGQKFCLSCGTRLAEVCPTCGTPIEAGAKFCGECGTQFGQTPAVGDGQASGNGQPVAPPAATPAVTAPTSPQAERRLVSVLFADLVGFTTLAEGSDSEPSAPAAERAGVETPA